MRARRLFLAALLAASAAGTTGGAQEAQVRLTPLAESHPARAGATVRLALQVDVVSGLHLQSNQPREPGLIATTLTFDPPPGLIVSEVVFPPSTDFQVAGFDQPLAVFDNRFFVGVTVQVAADRAPGPIVLPARLRYQACDERACYYPTALPASWTMTVAAPDAPVTTAHPDVFGTIAFGTGAAPPAGPALPPPAPAEGAATPAGDGLEQLDRFTIVGTGSYMNSREFLEFIANAEAGVTPRGWFDGRGPLFILGLVFVGGLALNLTPCVLPMIPINLGIIGAGAAQKRRGRGFLLGATYGAAMALVYGVLGLVVILTAATFGAINASPWFNAGVAALFVVLALAMFDVVPIDFSRFSNRIRFDEASRGTFFLAFGMGAIAALLAGACVAPVVIQVIVFAGDLYASGSWIALALPFVLGVGMAVPWPLAGAGLTALPRPGPWMVRVKQALGVFILGMAVYYGYLAYGLFANRFVDPEEVSASAREMIDAGWYADLGAGLAAAEANRTLVLIDVWATWCKNCLVMDRTTLADPAVVERLSGYTRIKLQAEEPDRLPARAVLERAGAIGLPAYVILRPKTAGTTLGS